MPAAGSGSASLLLPLPATEVQKSWHLLSLLLCIGEPTPLTLLASRSSLVSIDPSQIASLCSIPGSPISLTDNFLVTISVVGLNALVAYVARNFRIGGYSSSSIPTRDYMKVFPRKRRRMDDGEDLMLVPPSKKLQNDCKVLNQVSYGLSTILPPINLLAVKEVMYRPSLLAESNVRGEIDLNKLPEELSDSEPGPVLALPTEKLDQIDIKEVDCCSRFIPQRSEQTMISPMETGNDNANCETSCKVINQESFIGGSKKEQSIDLASPKQVIEDPSPSLNRDRLPEGDFKSIIRPSLDEDPIARVDTKDNIQVAELPVTEQVLPEPSTKKKSAKKDAVVAPELPAPIKTVGESLAVNTPRGKKHIKRVRMSIPEVKHSDSKNYMKIKERKGTSISIISKEQLKPKMLPKFESFIVEDEEGSGGYGTVYRARRKDDDTLVAIKCPRETADRHHINNELRMLEHFGGKNFVIKFQGSFKSYAGLDCFILEHIEHDRPEVLKKEIDVFQLQWYAYCMFKALSSLHKQGIVHRDVKPGNFLFSRKTSKGYLIDFNLAMDLYQTHKTADKSKVLNPTETKNVKKRAVGQIKAYNEYNSWSKINSQGADGSGITSAKDVSAMTRSAERPRGEPLPYQGRKELRNLVLQNQKHEAPHIPTPMRKRVAASPRNLNRPHLYLTPMPLQIKTKGDGKHKREGSCAGTKGFRAPEVLLRSPHQGPKVDAWSAGVTLLYLMIGRSPFIGDPEQNMKDIAKLRGSEDLWEVAKLHNRESSFPEDLYETQSLTSMNLREWCRMNTKRRGFLDEIPSSLFDLVDKCLTVNPRLRISAEDALKHDFFSSVHESMRKQRSLRQIQSLDYKTNFDGVI